jgi:hypothetical protein
MRPKGWGSIDPGIAICPERLPVYDNAETMLWKDEEVQSIK